jgi:hypothetical protein
MNRYSLSVLSVLLAATVASPQQIEWKDPSPHAVKFVTVDENVQLEVLDWGGSGPALVLLAGLGDTAHVFDDFATALTARHRVLAITRRAHGRSSTPPTGSGKSTRLASARIFETILSWPTTSSHVVGRYCSVNCIVVSPLFATYFELVSTPISAVPYDVTFFSLL